MGYIYPMIKAIVLHLARQHFLLHSFSNTGPHHRHTPIFGFIYNMSKGPLLPTNVPTMKPATASKAGAFATRKLAVGLLLITSFNLLIWRNPQISFYYFSNIHHKVSSWKSLPTFLEDVLIHPSVSTSINAVAAGPPEIQAHYPWTPSGREAPLAPEPGIDVPDTFDPTPYLIHDVAPRPSRKMTGEPGIDVWSPAESNEGRIFETGSSAMTDDEQ